MSRRPLRTKAVAVLLAAAYLVSVGRLLLRPGAAVLDPNIEIIRFAHWQIEPGVREAFNAIAADYMALHPNVRVEQLDIPGRAWKQWLRTGLVGDAAPDLIELASYENPDDVLARYFTPITAWLEEPNPYNAGEPDLRHLSWRQSYTSELVPSESVHYFSLNLLEYYGAPSAMVTVRVFYNRRLVREALGADRVPRTFDEFVALCEALARHAQATQTPVAPLAGSWFNLTKLTDELFSAASQRVALTVDISRDLEMTKHEALINYVRGRWALTTPAVRAGLQTVEAFGRYMAPGWLQLNREDAMLQFLQGRAAMLVTGTWDAGGILTQADFPVGAFKMPVFRRDDSKFGRWTLGPVSEAGTFAGVPFGLTRTSRHPEQAIDFLRFLTSRKSNAKFSRISTWLPVIKDVPVPKESEAFRPVEDGYVGGINIRFLGLRAHEVILQNLYLLSGNGASADAFIARTRGIFDRIYPEELARLAHISHETLRQKDSVLAGLYHLERERGLGRAKFDRLAANQLTVEADRLQTLRTLADYPPAK
jgi:raffinose/stachyose/melibiose transport system substrate-binding protein